MKNTIGKIFKSFIAACLVAGAAFSFAACTSENVSDPKDAVKRQYGNEEFSISFNTGGYGDPIEDVIYTANKMPVLPSPAR